MFFSKSLFLSLIFGTVYPCSIATNSFIFIPVDQNCADVVNRMKTRVGGKYKMVQLIV